jgi:copper(I)-binding protein
VTVSGAFLDSPAGSGYTAGTDAVANFTLAASGSRWDTLTSVSSPDARRVRLLLFDRVQEQISVPTSRTGEEASCQLVDLDHTLTPGGRVPLTFTFTDAGSLTLDVPVH